MADCAGALLESELCGRALLPAPTLLIQSCLVLRDGLRREVGGGAPTRLDWTSPNHFSRARHATHLALDGDWTAARSATCP